MERDTLRQRFLRWLRGKPAFETEDHASGGESVKQWVKQRGHGQVDTTGVVIGRNISCRSYLKALKLIDRQLTHCDNTYVVENLWQLCGPVHEVTTFETAVFVKEHYMPLLANILEKYTAAIRDGRIVAWEPKTDEDSPLDMEMIYLLVRYATPRGLLLVSRLVRENYRCSDPWWHTAFEQEQSRMIESGMYLMLLLKDFIPENILGVAYLQLCNLAIGYRDLALEKNLLLDEEAEEIEFPYASPTGRAKLAQYLSKTAADIPEDYLEFATEEAVNAIAWVDENDRLPLVYQAMQSGDNEIVLGGAIHGAKLNDETCLEKLAELATDWPHAAPAVECLRECKRTDLIPKIAEEPSFLPRSFMAWCLKEDGYAFPDEINVVDTREIIWPPSKERVQMFVLQFVYHAKAEGDQEIVDYGIVDNHYGRTVFPKETLEREPSMDEIFALHCAYEMQREHWKDPQVGLAMLKRHNPGTEFSQ